MGEDNSREFEIKRTFGLDVLLKITKSRNQATRDILEQSDDGKLYRTGDFERLNNDVAKTMDAYNIQLRIR
jgi:hypothetical protein